MIGDGFRFQLWSWPGRYSVLTSVSLVMLGSIVWQIRVIPNGGVTTSAAVAVVFGAAELVWLDQQQNHCELGFIFGDGLFAVAFRGRDM